MGIRVHKVIGYGVRGFVPPTGFLDRLNKLGEIKRSTLNRWVKKNRETIESLTGPGHHFDLDIMLMSKRLSAHGAAIFPENVGLVSYDDEFGLKDALLITPPTADPYWRRYDDIIDWLEETKSSGPRTRWEWLKYGIYPHDKGKTPASVAAVCLFLGVPNIFAQLREALYVWWS
jgi:hypothetical protein